MFNYAEKIGCDLTRGTLPVFSTRLKNVENIRQDNWYTGLVSNGASPAYESENSTLVPSCLLCIPSTKRVFLRRVRACPVRCGELLTIAVTTELLLVGAKTVLLLHT
jgi:hypothetical protein